MCLSRSCLKNKVLISMITLCRLYRILDCTPNEIVEVEKE